MNEELKIIIKAITDGAKKNIQQVRDELNKISKDGDKAGKTISETMKTIGKSAAVAVGAITALTAGMTALGNKAQEVNKGFEKLNTTFLNANSTTQQATGVYKELMGFLGEHDKAVETAQSLALITTEEEKLAEWTNILQGAFAEMGDKLPTEGLAEAANETIKVGQVVGVMADALNWAGVSEDAFNNALAQTASLEEREALVRSTLNGLYASSAALYSANNQATIQYNQSQANLNIALATAASYTTPLLTALNNLAATFLGSLGPAIRTVSLYLTAFIQLLASAISWVGGFFGGISSKAQKTTADVAGYRNAMKGYTDSLNKGFTANGKGVDSNIKKIKELKKQTMGFDELNVVSKPVDTSASGGGAGGGIGGGGIGAIPAIPNPEDFGLGGAIDIDFTKFKEDLETVKEKLKGALVLIGLIAAGFLAWKLVHIVPALVEAIKMLVKFKGNIDAIKGYESIVGGNTAALAEKFKQMGGMIMTAAGAMLLLQGYTDAWANGIDWGNMALMISGVALAVGGLYIAFGPLAAAIGGIVGGLALMTSGVKDFIEQGPTVQNTIMIIGGAVAAAVALATMGIGPLVAAIIAAVAAVVAFTAAIILEKPAIMSVEEAQEKLTAAKEKAADAENTYISAVDGAESALKRLQDAEKAAGMSGAALFEEVQNGNLTYEEMNSQQRELYKAYLDNEKKQQELKTATEELTAAKKAETIASFENDLALAKESGSYDDFKKSVVEAYKQGKLSAEEARDLIEKSMSEMSDASQQTFMEDLPGDIKEGMNPNRYETVKKKMGDWFSNAGKWIAEKFGKYFTADYWLGKLNEMKTGFKNGLNGIITVVERAINGIINKINTLQWKIPDWVPVFGGDTFGFNFKTISIPRLAKGGIVDSATYAMIGEAGKEAVVPLENNTEWMDRLAERLALQINTPSKIVLALDGRELGWATINGINGITKQTGQLQLRMV